MVTIISISISICICISISISISRIACGLIRQLVRKSGLQVYKSTRHSRLRRTLDSLYLGKQVLRRAAPHHHHTLSATMRVRNRKGSNILLQVYSNCRVPIRRLHIPYCKLTPFLMFVYFGCVTRNRSGLVVVTRVTHSGSEKR
jgi:hypothetical protein